MQFIKNPVVDTLGVKLQLDAANMRERMAFPPGMSDVTYERIAAANDHLVEAMVAAANKTRRPEDVPDMATIDGQVTTALTGDAKQALDNDAANTFWNDRKDVVREAIEREQHRLAREASHSAHLS